MKLVKTCNLAWTVGILFPLVGGAFLLVTQWMTDLVLSQTASATTQLQAEGQHQVQLALSLTIVSIDAEINRQTNITEVSIRAIGSPLEEMEFKFPVTEYDEIEAAISQELHLSSEAIRQFIRYRIDG